MSATIIAALASARFVQFVAAMAVLGTSLFPFYALPSRRADAVDIVTAMTPAAQLTLIVAAFAAALAALAWALATFVGVTGDIADIADPDTVSAFFFDTSFGSAWMVRLVVAVALVAAVLLLRTKLFAPNAATGVVAALVAALLISQAWIGHPAALSGPMRTIAIAAHATHVLAAGTWIGGLIPLALILARTRRAGRPAVAVFDRALHRFSIIGMAAIALLLAGGLVDASSRLGSPTAFVASAWGRVVVCKIVLFLAMITGASVNRFVLMPRLSARPEATMAGLARNIAFEQATGCLVLAAAALLGILTPPE